MSCGVREEVVFSVGLFISPISAKEEEDKDEEDERNESQ